MLRVEDSRSAATLVFQPPKPKATAGHAMSLFQAKTHLPATDAADHNPGLTTNTEINETMCHDDKQDTQGLLLQQAARATCSEGPETSTNWHTELGRRRKELTA